MSGLTCDLTQKNCKPCEGGVSPLNQQEASEMLSQIQGWELAADAKSLTQTFRFKDFYQTMAFVNAVAWIAHQEDHHPDLEVGYSRCLIRYSTHAIGGLSENDFICAAKIDALLHSNPDAS
jgi:4a-hydroxytetrahydrobiopterin dehydratase